MRRHFFLAMACLGLGASALAQTSPAAAIAGYQVVLKESAVDATPMKQVTAQCPVGKKALGAGWGVLDPTGAILEGQATYSEPAFNGSQWIVNAKKLSTFAPNWKLRVRLICASAQ